MNLSELDIVNGGLDFAGAGRILSLAENSTEAAACRRHWPLVRQYVFETHPWKCISKQATLTTQTTAPQFGFRSAYPLPADYVRMMGMDYATRQFKVFNGALHTDQNPAYIDYVFLCLDPTRYSAGLCNVLQLQLGYRLALALRQDADLAERIMLDLEKFFLPLVRNADASGQGQRLQTQDTLTDMFR
jgi:hypothetical protein